jgi:hypothetical protein
MWWVSYLESAALVARAPSQRLKLSVRGGRSMVNGEGRVMRNETINRVSGHVVLGLSIFAMLLVVGATVLAMLGKFNPSPTGDEGTAAHLFQLAIVLLVPVGLAYLVTADWREPLKVAKRLIVPALALVVAFSALYYMEHVR